MNSRQVSSTGIAPNDVTTENAHAIFRKLYPAISRNLQPETGLRPKLKVNDIVRVLAPKKEFTKGDIPRASEELYRVARIHFHPTIRYILKEAESGELISGSFSIEEVIRVSPKSE
jgi:hypothetical protein